MQVSGMTDAEFLFLMKDYDELMLPIHRQFLGVTDNCQCVFHVMTEDSGHYLTVSFNDDGKMVVTGELDPDVVNIQQFW
jgi:hypothetical protein